MSISLNQLKSVMNKITQVGYLEKVITLSDNTIVIKTLTPKEESELQKVISDLTKEEDITTLEFVDRVRKETLSRAIIQVNDLNLRDIEMIETDEVLPNGLKVSISRQEAVSLMIEDLPRLLLGKVFEEMSKLTEEVEEKTNKILSTSALDVKAEVEILEKRISQLKFQEQSKILDESATKNTTNMLNIKGDSTLGEQLKKIGESV